jgi:hypothetical protein
MTRPVTEMDFRMEEYRHPDVKPEDYEFRSSDGRLVRKDRWETSMRSVASAVRMPREYELPDVVDRVRQVHADYTEAMEFLRENRSFFTNSEYHQELATLDSLLKTFEEVHE